MSNKKVIKTYMEGFNEGDHAKILSCLTDNVIWEMHGLFSHVGKEAFDKEIENEAFEGRPTITLIRMVEEGNIVVAEGNVKFKVKNGPMMHTVICDVFHFEGDKIKQLTGYIMTPK